MLIYGINPVLEALRAGRVTAVRIAQRADGRLAALLEIAATSGVSVRRGAPGDLDRAAPGGVHQGAAAGLRGGGRVGVEGLVLQARGVPLTVVLDGIQAPQNVGAILR